MRNPSSALLNKVAEAQGLPRGDYTELDPRRPGKMRTWLEIERERTALERETLEWALDFAQRTEPSTLDRFVLHDRYRLPEAEMTFEKVRDLARTLHDGIRALVVEKKDWDIPLPSGVKLRAFWAGSTAAHSELVGTTPETFFLVEMNELVVKYATNIRACERSGCGRLFLPARKKQSGCSRSCSQAVWFEARKKRFVDELVKKEGLTPEAANERWSDLRHQEYRQQVAKTDPDRAKRVQRRKSRG